VSEKQKIELMVPEELLEEYLAQINISDDFVARSFEWENDKDWTEVNIVLVEGTSYSKLLKSIEVFPDTVEIILVEDLQEQYLYKAQLERHGVHFTSRSKFLEQFDTSDIQEEQPSKEPKKRSRETKKALSNMIALFKSKKETDQDKKKPSITKLLNQKKPVTQKVEVRSSEKEKWIPVIKKQEISKDISTQGTYMVCMSAFVCFLLSEYLSLRAPVAVMDFTGELNQYFGSEEKGKIKELLSGHDNPLIISKKLYYYGDTFEDISIESLLKIKEMLLENADIILMNVPFELAEEITPAVDKMFYCITEEDVIRGVDIQVSAVNMNKLKILLNKRLNIISRSDIRARLNLDERLELIEIPLIEQNDLRSIYKSVEKEESLKISVIEKYFKKFSEQL